MVAQPDVTQGFQAAPATSGARRDDIAWDLLPLTEASCVLASMADALILTDLAGWITYLNPAAVRLTGWAAPEAVGQPLEVVLTLISESTREPVANTATRCLKAGRSVDLEDGVVLVRRDGSEVPIGDSAAPVRDDHGAVIGAVVVMQDEGEKRRIGRRLSYEASHDALTGLINRREFDRRLARIVAEPGGRAADQALLLIDLDRFKAVNDTGGHEAGDALLARLGPLLHRHLRTGDTLARLGGDEFGVLLENRTLPDAERVAEA
ncbi:MAG: diguanylate cyclase domain-containing protein, partial [Gemmatimonadales bacterium]